MTHESRSERETLIVFLRPRLTLALADEPPGDHFVVGDRSYRDSGHGDFIGFYDWLRSPSRELLGVRYWPFAEIDFPAAACDQLSYVVVEGEGSSLEVYFSPRRDYAAGVSDSQDFGENKLFSSEEGEFVISFGTHWLTDSDIERLRGCPVEWVSLTR